MMQTGPLQLSKTYSIKDVSADNLRESFRTKKSIENGLVRTIMQTVKSGGDRAILGYAFKYDQLERKSLNVEHREILSSAAKITTEVRAAIDCQLINLTRYHENQVHGGFAVNISSSIQAGQLVRPVDRAGLYIPGGTAPLVSTLAMLLVPATLAKVPSIAVCTPCGDIDLNPAIAYLLEKFSVTEAYRIGGAQAVAAMAFGSESIQKVNKIFGPGNQYVNSAKTIASEYGVAIDMPAGPSELLIICDHTANSDFIAADIIAQAEHGIDTPVVVITIDASLAAGIIRSLTTALESLPRRTFAEQSLSMFTLIRATTIAEAISFSNQFAPEHLSLQIEEPSTYMDQIQNAGSVFLGHYSPEALGDYLSGPNHTLPTGGAAAAFSGITVGSFQKTISWQSVTPDAYPKYSSHAAVLARVEGLEGHARSLEVRHVNKNHIK